jgi:catechol-2,3-dioxygenase
MQVVGFDHYNLRAARSLLDDLRNFYCDVVGLTAGDRPPFRSFGYWLYAGGRPVLHLSEAKPQERRPPDVPSTFSHASFSCIGRLEFERRLAARGIEYRVAQVPQVGQVQLFFNDPAGNGVELSFPADEA